MGRVFVSSGSNIGDRLGFLQKAVDALGNAGGFKVKAVSPVYETEPVGKKDQPQFLNAAVELESLLSPDSILVNLKQIERVVGRTPSQKWGPREIDLDLIYIGNLVVKSPMLTLPHPEVAGRRFVLTPLTDIAPDFVDPLRKRTLRELLSSCPDVCDVAKTTFMLHFSDVEN
jgi:2-amino-4-hydroxy-6-hydroxymethyldihydropteridine diphosphokinase